uniref:Uncharacterized protein n=1 Tax=Trichuris muris TaxID=70415 RepID=A0A5S6Q165_TRIMR
MQVQLSVHSTPQRWNDPSRNRLPHVFRVGSSGLLSPHAVMYDWTSCKCLATVVPPQKNDAISATVASPMSKNIGHPRFALRSQRHLLSEEIWKKYPYPAN